MSKKIGIQHDSLRSPTWRPRMQLLLFSCLSVLLSSVRVYNLPNPKGPAASKRNVIDKLSLFLTGRVWCTSKMEGLSFTSIFIYINVLFSPTNPLTDNSNTAVFRQHSIGSYFGGQYISSPPSSSS